MFGLFLLFWGLFVLLSLITHSQADPSLNHVVSGTVTVHNRAGLFGAFLSGLLVDVFGLSAYIWPLFFMAWGAGCVSSLVRLPWWRWVGLVMLAVCLLSLGTAWNLGLGDVRGGGMFGRLLYGWGTRFFSPAGFTLIWLFVLFIALELCFGIPWLELLKKATRAVRDLAGQYRDTPGQMADRLKALFPGLALPAGLKRLPRLGLPGAAADGGSGAPDNRTSGPASSGGLPELIIDLGSVADRIDPDPEAERPTDMFGRLPGQEPRNVAPGGFLFREGPIATDQPEADEDDADGLNAGEAFGFDDGAPERVHHGATAWEADALPLQAESGPVSPRSLLLGEGEVSYTPSWAGGQDPDGSPGQTSGHGGEGSEFLFAAGPPAAVPEASTPGASIPDSLIATPPAPPSGSPPPKRLKAALPGLDLLSSPEPVPGAPPSREVLAAKGERLMACLADFGIQGEMAYITPGPVISMFEIRPAPGVKVSRILNLSDDLALALKATAVRIQAPVPGSDTVGVEIPNETRAIVSFRELLEDPTYSESTAPLSMALGKDIGGHPFTTDLSRMPHLLVAGATGAGKSVCLNSILLSFLYKSTPDDVRFLLVDPKRIELAVYADLPHLVHPVVTEVQLAKNALDWAVHEMDARYDAMARLGVRNIAGYNKKLADFGQSPPPGLEDLRPLPFLVIIIDELSDLMMTAGKEIEAHIVRLAQLARAAGIHLIVATQRPSVDVVTGLIKANFPCRISFQVSSKHDSRTILDTVGAEHLLGKGDMLFKPSGGKLQRLHGAFVSDDEVVSVVEHWKRQQAPDYAIDFNDWGTDGGNGQLIVPGGLEGAGNGEDGLYAEVIAFVREQGKVSISLIQRRFRIGFNKAARFVEQMEQDGIIQPGDRQNKARQVVRD